MSTRVFCAGVDRQKAMMTEHMIRCPPNIWGTVNGSVTLNRFVGSTSLSCKRCKLFVDELDEEEPGRCMQEELCVSASGCVVRWLEGYQHMLRGLRSF